VLNTTTAVIRSEMVLWNFVHLQGSEDLQGPQALQSLQDSRLVAKKLRMFTRLTSIAPLIFDKLFFQTSGNCYKIYYGKLSQILGSRRLDQYPSKRII
jgi:hypothetical protein